MVIPLEKREFPPPYNLAYERYSRIGDRRDSAGNLSFGNKQSPDLESHLFPIEEELRQSLLSACSEYMDGDGMSLIHNALALSLFAHQNHYRDSNEPYSTHFLNVALPLAQELKLDPVTIASALLHDTIEDTDITTEEIRDEISPEVAQTVSALTQFKGRFQRKSLADEDNRLKIINSLLDNPRVAIIKIFDRLHNMRTLQTKKGRAKRLAILQETQDVYVPLAERLGLFEEAAELDDLSLRKRSKRHAGLADNILSLRKNFLAKKLIHPILTRISDMVTIPVKYLKVRVPSVYDIYRQVGEKRDVTIDDFYYQIDIILPEVYQRIRVKDSSSWGEIAMGIESMLNFSEEFELVTEVDERRFKEEIDADLADSLSFEVKAKVEEVRLRINIFPQDAYERETTSLTDLYFLHAISESEKALSAMPLGSSEETQKHIQAYGKYADLRRRFNIVVGKIISGENVSTQILRFLEPRLPTGYIRVVGVDDQGSELMWVVKDGSTILDYAKDIFQEDWIKTHAAWINNLDNLVPLNYILKPGDKVHIVFRKKSNVHPLWIYSFHTDPEGVEEVRRRIRRILASTEEDKKEWMLQQLFMVGKWRIEQELELDNRPLRVGLSPGKEVYLAYDEDLTEEDFYLKVGLGEIPDEVIKKVAESVAGANKMVGRFTVIFDQNTSGQALSVLRSVAQINLLDSSTRTFGSVQAHVELFIDPDDAPSVKDIIRRIMGSEECRNLGLRAITYKDHRTVIFRAVQVRKR